MILQATSRVIVLWGALLAGLAPACATESAVARSVAPDSLAVASDARLGGDENRTRFVLDLTKKVDITPFTLADPYRVVVDLPQVAFRLPPHTGESGRGLIKAFRYGLIMQGGSRIVLDATGPVRVDKAFVLDPIDGQPARLVLDLVAVDRETFMRILAADNRPQQVADPIKKPASVPKNGDTRPLIVIDPGHGGPDSGTSAESGETEKSIVLDFGLRLRDKLERTGKYRVVMTRSDDRFVPLSERVRIARTQQAALFLSIHADALARRDQEAHGATIYTLSETASDAEAGRLAEAENRADVIAGVDLSAEPGDVADILIDLAQRETKSFSMHFARALAGGLKNSVRLHKRPLKAAGFRVLKAPDVPSVLLELGYVSNRQDLNQLTSEAWRSQAADAIVQAIHTFFATRIAGTQPGGD